MVTTSITWLHSVGQPVIDEQGIFFAGHFTVKVELPA